MISDAWAAQRMKLDNIATMSPAIMDFDEVSILCHQYNMIRHDLTSSPKVALSGIPVDEDSGSRG